MFTCVQYTRIHTCSKLQTVKITSQTARIENSTRATDTPLPLSYPPTPPPPHTPPPLTEKKVSGPHDRLDVPHIFRTIRGDDLIRYRTAGAEGTVTLSREQLWQTVFVCMCKAEHVWVRNSRGQDGLEYTVFVLLWGKRVSKPKTFVTTNVMYL